jgi:hypothetical protein
LFLVRGFLFAQKGTEGKQTNVSLANAGEGHAANATFSKDSRNQAVA